MSRTEDVVVGGMGGYRVSSPRSRSWRSFGGDSESTCDEAEKSMEVVDGREREKREYVPEETMGMELKDACF